jgi:hypothetical protein
LPGLNWSWKGSDDEIKALREFAKIYFFVLRVNQLSSSTERWRKVSALCQIICVGFADNRQATAVKYWQSDEYGLT